MIDASTWKEFRIRDLFPVLQRGKCHAASELDDGDDVWYVGAKKNENGLMRRVKKEPDMVFDGNCIVFICNGQGSVGYALYQDKPFIPSGDLIVGYNDHLNQKTGLFLVTVLDLERAKYSFGRKWGKYVADTVIRLPADTDGSPDWDWMEQYMDSLSVKPITTRVKSFDMLSTADTKAWKEFRLNRLYSIQTGDGLSRVDMTESDPTVNFVSRISFDNGVVGSVDRLEDVEPHPAGLMTIALGGSYLGSAFIQNKPFYTGAHMSIATPLFEEMSIHVQQFIATLIRIEARTKYCAYGRELDTHINREFSIKLPVDDGGNPDWAWMDNYMRCLPYSDRIA